MTLQQWIKSAGTPSQVAHFLGVTRQAVHLWLKGQRPSVNNWDKIIKASDGKVTVDTLAKMKGLR